MRRTFLIGGGTVVDGQRTIDAAIHILTGNCPGQNIGPVVQPLAQAE